MTQKILIGGHRGLGATDSANAQKQYRDHATMVPENTLESLTGAFIAGADFIEFDVVPAKDGLAICHSARLADHVFTPPANKVYTAEFTLAGLNQLMVGHRGEPQDRIPSLPAMLEAVRPQLTGERFLNLEIKGLQGTGEQFSPAAQQGFITSILQTVHDAKLLARVLFSSFRTSDLLHLKSLLPGAQLAQLFVAKEEPDHLVFTAESMATIMRTLPGVTLHPPLRSFTGDTPAPAIPAGTKVNIWVDQILPLAQVSQGWQQARAQLPHIPQLGIITDYPVELLAEIRPNAEK